MSYTIWTASLKYIASELCLEFSFYAVGKMYARVFFQAAVWKVAFVGILRCLKCKDMLHGLSICSVLVEFFFVTSQWNVVTSISTVDSQL